MDKPHKKLIAWQLAMDIAVDIYKTSENFPSDEKFGLTSQMRRAAVSIASNIVEGCARHSERDYIRFLDMAYGSSRELQYQVSLARRLGYLNE